MSDRTSLQTAVNKDLNENISHGLAEKQQDFTRRDLLRKSSANLTKSVSII